jgi:hypothetical protein
VFNQPACAALIRQFRIHGHEQIIPLPAQEQHRHLVLFNFGGHFLIIVQGFDDFVIHFLNHIATL